MNPLARIKRTISEISGNLSDGFVSVFFPFSMSGLRSKIRTLSSKYWGSAPAYENTLIDYDSARQLYRNDGEDKNLGSIFCRPIIDLQVDFIGLPTAVTDSEEIDNDLNDCIKDYWADEIQQMLRDAMRDSKVVVRIKRPSLDDPLMTADEAEHCTLECLPPERVMFLRNNKNKNIVDEVVVYHNILMMDENFDFSTGELPRETEHQVLEIVTPDNVRFYDRTVHEEIEDWGYVNAWGFVPYVEVWNDFDASLQGGQSDLEAPYPFIRAFHDVVAQSLQAHKYHSIPKVMLKLQDVGPFIKNNFSDAVDPVTGQIKGEVSWTGKEIIFLQEDEDAKFLEARSVLGDSRQLAEFLLECICVASRTPKWAFMVVDTGAANQANNAQTVPFTKKIDKKRKSFQEPIQMLLKMYMKIVGITPVKAQIRWEAQQVTDQVAHMQALQMLVAGLEIAAQRGIISDTTYREMLRTFIPMMKSPSQEEEAAKDNAMPEMAVGPVNVPVDGRNTDQQTTSKNGSGNKSNVPVPAGK
jgi:hypothetical protein